MLQEQIALQLRKNEVPYEKFTIQPKFQHFLLNKNLTAVSYDEEKGLASFLEYLMQNADWEGIYENDYIIGAQKENMHLLLKAGGQVELTLDPTISLQEIDRTYLKFIQGVIPELERRSQVLLSVGCQPKSDVKDIQTVPMALNEIMLDSLKDDKAAVEILKSTAKTGVVISYAHSDDFEKKLNVAQLLAPVLTAIFDNAALKAGKAYDGDCGNQALYNEVKSPLFKQANVIDAENYKYNEYAAYLAAQPVVAVAHGEELEAKHGTAAAAYGQNEVSEDEAQAVINMNQSDLRVTAGGIEFDGVDALPYPLNMAYLALIKGIFHTKEHMDDIVDSFKELSTLQLEQLKHDITVNGLDAKFNDGTLREYAKDLYFMVMPTMEPVEQHYIQPLDLVLFKEATPKKVMARQLLK